MGAVTLLAELLGATGGTSISALVQTSLDGGSVWLDVARFDFTTSAAKKWCVLQGRRRQSDRELRSRYHPRASTTG